MKIGNLWRKLTYPLRMFFIEHPSIIIINHPDVPRCQWRDRDTRLLCAAFQILQDFVDKEYGGLEEIYKRIEWGEDSDECSSEHLEFYYELLELYIWWTVDRPHRLDAFEREFVGNKRTGPGLWDFTPEYREWLRECGRIEEEQFKEDDDMLMRLVKIRRCLWT